MRSAVLLLIAAAVAAGALAGCAAHRPSAPPLTEISTITRTVAPPTASSGPTGPLGSGPTAAADVTACPLLAQATAADAVGMRLARITSLTQGSTLIGCRFYALQGSSLTQSEQLPGPDQPAVEIVTSIYANSMAARNAAVALADSGSSQQVVTLTGGVEGDVFQTTFDPGDGPSDWVLVFNKDAVLVVVRTAITDTSLDAVSVGNDIVAGIS